MANNPPFPVNPTATVVDDAIDGVFGVAVKMAEASLAAATLAAIPNPIIDSLLDTIGDEGIQLLSQEIYKNFAQMVSFDIIDPIQVGGELSTEAKALVALKAAQAGGNKDAIAAARAAFEAATEGLTVFDGATKP